ncbi:MAG: hypothetical protein HQ498_03010 [Pseudohongiella sp.]|nr:hypothetical protein [Pseudohongiella sp.]
MTRAREKSRLLIVDDEVEIGELFKPVAENRGGVAACDADESQVAVLTETGDPHVIASQAREMFSSGY